MEEISADSASRYWWIPGTHVRLTQVIFADGTDRANELVHEKEWLLHPREVLQLSGNLFCLENLETGVGHLWVLPEPLPHARPEGKGEADLEFCLMPEGKVRVGSVNPLTAEEWVQLMWRGGELARSRVFQEWQRRQRPPHPHHQLPRFLSNTWGDRSRDGRLCEAFMLAEIEAAAELGVEVVQLDDGWQKGISSNSIRAAQGGIWQGFWNQDPDFWQTHPVRFPRGLAPLVDRAHTLGVRLGLWYAPDSWQDFAHWLRDADRILELHRTHGICFFKIDGIQVGSAKGLRHLRQMMHRVLEGSQASVVLDLDITAGLRPGYWGMMACGPLFVENRYTDSRSYWPHHTFRNLWKLARWIDPRRLRMECLNNDRNQKLYADDPLAPHLYGADTLFATVMAANPLGWFEISGLSASYRKEMKELVTLWKRHREAFFEGTILPLGPCPDGFNISGLASVDAKGEGSLLLLRGAGQDPQIGIAWPAALGEIRLQVLHGQGTAVIRKGTLQCQLPLPCSHLWIKVTGANGPQPSFV